MITPACKHETTKKHGRDKFGQQRFKCLLCGATFIKSKPKMLGDSRLPVDRAVMCLKLLLEGMSIRATSRLTGTDKNAIIALVTTLGPRCQNFLKAKIQNVPVAEVECDELWGFVGAKQKTCDRMGFGPTLGDAYCYVAMERNSKLVLTYHVDKRSSEGTWEFIDNLYFATSGRFQISTDGYRPYQTAIPLVFKFAIDYSQVIKRFGWGNDREGAQRYSPANMVSTQITRGCGDPDLDRACTSHSERLNLSLRMQIRRLTRLTNAHSKKWENHEAMLGLYFAWYNFCRKHSTIKTTPAKEHGLTDHEWAIEELLREVATF
jgi:transposase-like protein/IS1 family transposase